MHQTGVSLSFRVVNCPGPPKDVYDIPTLGTKAKKMTKRILNRGDKK